MGPAEFFQRSSERCRFGLRSARCLQHWITHEVAVGGRSGRRRWREALGQIAAETKAAREGLQVDFALKAGGGQLRQHRTRATRAPDSNTSP